MSSQKCLSGGPLFSARGGSGPQQARGGLQEAIRGLRQDASQIQLGRAGTGSGSLLLPVNQSKCPVTRDVRAEYDCVCVCVCVCVSTMEPGLCVSCVWTLLMCIMCLCASSAVYQNTYRACSSVTVGKLRAGSLGKCSPIHRNQRRI